MAALLALLLVIAAAKLGQQVYRWYAYAEEREHLAVLGAQVEAAGLEVVRSQMRADSLRALIQQLDRELAEGRRAVGAYDGHASGGALPPYLFEAYRGELRAYNGRVAERNSHFEEWQAVVTRNHAAVGRYNLLADSVRAVARRMGEPYYPVPSPAELALEHGLVPGSR